MIMENVCHRWDIIATLNMVRKGLFGELLHYQESIANNSTSVEIPNFTRGKWKTNQPIFALTDEI